MGSKSFTKITHTIFTKIIHTIFSFSSCMCGDRNGEKQVTKDSNSKLNQGRS